MLIGEALALATQELKAHKLESAALDAALILGHLVKLSRTGLIAHDTEALPPQLETAFFTLIRKRSCGYPVAYILGYKDFYGLKLKVNEHTLIPRPDTETLVEAALSLTGVRTVLDLGTGSGAIILALKASRPQWQCSACDVSAKTLAVAQENARRLRLEVEFKQSDWFEAYDGQTFDLIVSNPPYIASTDEHLALTSLPYEPQLALISGAQGCDALQTIIQQAGSHLTAHGVLMLEHGYEQGETCRSLLQQAGFAGVHTLQDLGGHERVSVGELQSSR